MSNTAYVARLPMCDIHKYEKSNPNVVARYDGKTIHGPWANMCDECFATHGVGLGTGKGQELIIGDKPPVTAREIQQAIADGDFDLAEDLIGDGDIAEWL